MTERKSGLFGWMLTTHFHLSGDGLGVTLMGKPLYREVGFRELSSELNRVADSIEQLWQDWTPPSGLNLRLRLTLSVPTGASRRAPSYASSQNAAYSAQSDLLGCDCRNGTFCYHCQPERFPEGHPFSAT